MTTESDKAALEFIRQAQGAPEVAQWLGDWYVLERYGRVRNSDVWWHEETGLTTIGDSCISRLAYRPVVPPPPLDGWELAGEATRNMLIVNDWFLEGDNAVEKDGLRWRLRRKPAEPAVAAPIADAVRDFEERITPHILRNWDRERIVAFATHLLGDTCQGCQKVAPAVTAGGAIASTLLLAGDSQFRCTVCGRIGTVGRCCGRDTREPMNDIARAEIEAERKAERRVSA